MDCNTRVEEYDFLISITCDLKNNYPEHNKKVLEQLIQHLSYLRDREETQSVHRFNQQE